MTYRFRVELHPLGVVVVRKENNRRELLIPGEECCGVTVEELAKIAMTDGIVEVADEAACKCPLGQGMNEGLVSR
jgi:hypothetical protein